MSVSQGSALPAGATSTPTTVLATPRRRKRVDGDRLHGIRLNNVQDASAIARSVKTKLKLLFDLEDWQAELISRIHRGFDGIFIAGTGYGKSLVFEGLACLEQKKVVIVICPLKALEADQVRIRRS